MSDSTIKNEECIKLFCKTIAELNAISLKQLEGLLNLAATAAQAAGANGSADGAQRLVDELKTTAEAIAGSARTKEEEIFNRVKEATAGESEEYFCSAVEEKLIIAFENALANQQQLNVTGDAILTQAASIIFSSAGKTDS